MAVQIPTRRPKAAMRSMKPLLEDELGKLHEIRKTFDGRITK